MRTRGAFTMIEMTVGILVMCVTLAVAVISPRAIRQSAKREAERLSGYIHRIMQKSERTHKNFLLDFAADSVSVNWHAITTTDDSFKASHGCSYSNNFPSGYAMYNPHKQMFQQPGTITVYGADGETYYVICAGITEGRVRVSPTPPED